MGAGEVPGENGYVSYVFALLCMMMRFIVKLICERTEVCRLH